MPNKLKKPCRQPGCPNLTHDGYCEDHKDQGRQYDRDRGGSTERGYGSRWQRYRRWYLRHNPICVRCEHPATVVDHIIPFRPGDAFYDPTNHQALCTTCHNRKTATEDRR
ncbi:MAG: HNH endonuclease [Actinomycetota bacterium]